MLVKAPPRISIRALKALRGLVWAASLATSLWLESDRRRHIISLQELTRNGRILRNSPRHRSFHSSASPQDLNSEPMILREFRSRYGPLPPECDEKPAEQSQSSQPAEADFDSQHRRLKFGDGSSKAPSIEQANLVSYIPYPLGFDKRPLITSTLRDTPDSSELPSENPEPAKPNEIWSSKLRKHQQNQDINAIFQRFDKSQPKALADIIKELLARSHVEEASKLFLEKFKFIDLDPTSDISTIADSLCIATLGAKLYSITERVFWCAWEYGKSSALAWNALIQSKGQQNDHNQVLKLFNHFRLEGFQTSATTAAMVFTSMIVEGKHINAEFFLRSLLQNLPLSTNSAYAIILKGLWQTNRDFPIARAFFQAATSLFPKHPPTTAFYNLMVQCCIESGQTKEALVYLSDMKETYGLNLTARTSGFLLLQQAFPDDIASIETRLRTIPDFRMEFSFDEPIKLPEFLNSTLISVANVRGVAELERILAIAIGTLKYAPDVNTRDIVIKTLARNGKFQSIGHWLKVMAGFGIHPDPVVTNVALYHHWRKSKTKHTEMWKLYKSIRGFNRNLIDIPTHDILRRAIVHDFSKSIPGLKKGRSSLEQFDELDKAQDSFGPRVELHPTNVRMTMMVEMAKKNPAEAVRVFEAAKNELPGITVEHPDLLDMAVEASIRANKGRMGTAVQILKEAHASGAEVSEALVGVLIHQFYHTRGRGISLQSVARDFHETLASRKLPLKRFVTVTAADTLINQRKPAAAIRLMRSMNDLPELRDIPPDIAHLTIYLKAFGALRDRGGIDWCLHMLKSLGLCPDHKFINALRGTKMAIYPFLNSAKTVEERAPHQHSIDRLNDDIFEMRKLQRKTTTTNSRRGRWLVWQIKKNSPQI
ncbi:MAG: hypothetical protein M1829_002072 [Trizodia sp. TS-e1964]|nr:MAG: hypothetical protein M1829_002072 [Trizodia sp. TS-e1964]